MIRITKLFSLLLLLCLSGYAAAQTDATLLVTPNLDAKILIDGLEQGKTKAGVTLKITVTGGEHYVEIQTKDGLTVGQIVQLQSGKEETLKINIGNSEVVPAGSIAVADLNMELPDSATINSWQLSNDGNQYPYPEYYYAFEKGDEIVLNLAVLNKNGTNRISVSTYPDHKEQYTNDAFTELNDLRISVPERSIYRIAFGANTGISRNAFLKISRIPASPQTANFNTKVSNKKKLTPVAVVEPRNVYVNGGMNATPKKSKSRVIIPVTLPPNTVEWFYRFSASRDTTIIEIVKKNFGLLNEVTRHLFIPGVDSAVAPLLIEKLSQPPGANYCDIYFLDRQFIQAFEAKEDKQWRYLPEASRKNFMAGNVKVTCCNSGKYYLGINNPDSSLGVNVFIEVVAIVAKNEFSMEAKP